MTWQLKRCLTRRVSASLSQGQKPSSSHSRYDIYRIIFWCWALYFLLPHNWAPLVQSVLPYSLLCSVILHWFYFMFPSFLGWIHFVLLVKLHCIAAGGHVVWEVSVPSVREYSEFKGLWENEIPSRRARRGPSLPLGEFCPQYPPPVTEHSANSESAIQNRKRVSAFMCLKDTWNDAETV